MAQARDLFRSGVQRLQASEWTAACDLLGRSLALVETAQTHFHLARCSAELGRVLDQAEHLRAFARLAGPDVPPEEVDDARNRAVLLDPRIPRVRIRFTTPPRGRVALRVDGAEVPRAAWSEPRPVNPGELRIEVEGERYVDYATTTRVTEGQTVEIEVVLVLRPRVAAADGAAARGDSDRRPPERPVDRPASRAVTAQWWFWATIGAVVVVGTGVAVYAATRDDGTTRTPSIDFPPGTYVFHP
ncbi:MAG: hypothetical protein IT379_15470 [Deltaproteobacteria bacterium]|nr:hypothetical protein [Deltaproteobacteria bacterium]